MIVENILIRNSDQVQIYSFGDARSGNPKVEGVWESYPLQVWQTIFITDLLLALFLATYKCHD